jgi:hypothetical protein
MDGKAAHTHQATVNHAGVWGRAVRRAQQADEHIRGGRRRRRALHAVGATRARSHDPRFLQSSTGRLVLMNIYFPSCYRSIRRPSILVNFCDILT